MQNWITVGIDQEPPADRLTLSRCVVSIARPTIATGKQPSPICQAAAGIGDILSGSLFDSTVPSAKPIEPPSAIKIPGSLAADGRKAVAAHDRGEARERHHQRDRAQQVGRSPSTGQASSEAQTGMV